MMNMTKVFIMCIFATFVASTNIQQPNVSTLANLEVPPTTPPTFVPMDLPLDLSEFMKVHPSLDQTAGFTNKASPAPASKKCECGVFNTKAPTESDVPLWSHPPTCTTCDVAGELTCLKTCSNFAETAQEPMWICTILGEYNKLKASIHSRNCGATTWTYTGLTFPNEICCLDHQVVPCTDKLAAPPANLVLAKL